MLNKELVFVGERNFKNKIVLMSWSSKRDLICLASQKGEVLLHRLSSLEKVWIYPPVDKDCTINSICWRPDGKVIGVSYNSKDIGIHFIYMEKAQVLYKLNSERIHLKYPGKLLKWFDLENFNSEIPTQKFSSLSFKDYISDLPKLQSKDITNIEINNVIGSSRFHILLVSDDHNTITAFAYAIFPLFSIPCGFYGPSGCEVEVCNMCMSSDFQYICSIVTTSDNKSNCSIQLVSISKVIHDLDKCKLLAEEVCHLKSILNYIENVLDLMKESCETVVQEMESKLTKHLVNKNLAGTIGDEFMHFLLWGKPSEVIEELLTNSLSSKGVTKLGTLVESSYTSIQQLLLVNFQLAADALYYHLVEIKGMCTSSILDDFKLLDSNQVEEILALTGSFTLKATEMQHVIEESLKNFKAFFRWLYSSLLKLNGPESTDVLPMSMKDMEFVADFIMESFIYQHEMLKSSGKEKRFNLDKVYQYLQDCKLTYPQNASGNDWFRLVEATPTLSSNPLILKRRNDASLRQLFVELKDQIKTLVYCSSNVVSAENISHHPYLLHPSPSFIPFNDVWFHSEKEGFNCFYALTSKDKLPCFELILSQVSTSLKQFNKIRINFSVPGCPDQFYLIEHFAYFNNEYFVVVATHESSSNILMTSISSVLEELNKKDTNTDKDSLHLCDCSCFVSLCRAIAPMIAKRVASSGSRNILSVINDDHHLLKAYELDQTNDDEMEDDSTLDSSLIST